MKPPPLDVRPVVAAALRDGKPVAALGSAAIAHSLPWPENLETVHLAEAAARQEGATLAVVAVWQGRLTVGLTAAEIETLARGGSALRASRRDLPTAIVRGMTAATTVAASMYIASRAGIRVLAAGAIGGAARGDVHGWDVSADLVELARTPVAVVTGGGRSVLNLTRTGEILESYGVPVVGYGTDTLPIFYQRFGGHPASVRADRPGEAAALLSAHWGMGGAGVVVAQPTPEDVALSPDQLHPALLAVEQQAAADRVRAKDLPSFLIDRLNRLTWGKASIAYRAIFVANARLAAQIARELIGGEIGDAPPPP